MPKEEKGQERENRPERWSAQAKMEVVLRLLKGEDLGEISREIQVPPPELEAWRLGAGAAAELPSPWGGGLSTLSIHRSDREESFSVRLAPARQEKPDILHQVEEARILG